MSEFVEYTDPIWRGLNLRQLNVDEAYIVLDSSYANKSYLYTLSEECYTCPYSKAAELHPNNIEAHKNLLTLNVARGWSFKLLEEDVGPYSFDNDTYICQFQRNDLREFGVYNLTLSSYGNCEFAVDNNGVNIYWSLLSMFVLMLLSLATLRIAWCAWKTYNYDEEAAAAEQINVAVNTNRRRMRSLDAFRGLAIVLMIFVNSGGGAYWWIEHAPWNGLHLADIVFPSFLWIMGACLPISVRSQIAKGIPRARICRRIIWRSIKLFVVGLCLNSVHGPALEELRIMGVLQRFSIAYLVCGLLHTICSQVEVTLPQHSWQRSVMDLLLIKREMAAILLLITVHLCIIFALPVPDCPTGYLGPGGKSDYGAHPNCIGGATGYIDEMLLGTAHMYQHPTAKYIYDSKAFDPEGIFGCILTIVQVLWGLLAGTTILTFTNWKARIKRWLLWSVVLALLAGSLCDFTKETGTIPINKNLWSLSFVLLTSAICFLLLSFLYLIIDVQQWWHGSPFVEAGMNAIIMYVGHTVMHKMLPWHWRLGAMNTHFVLLLECTWNTLLWIAIALYLDAKKFYYSI